MDFWQLDMCDITHQTLPLNNAPQCHLTMHHDGIQRRKHEHQEVRRQGRQCRHLWCAVFFNFIFIFILTYQVPPLFEQIQCERGGRVQPLPFCFHHHHLDVETRCHHHSTTTATSPMPTTTAASAAAANNTTATRQCQSCRCKRTTMTAITPTAADAHGQL